MIPRPSATLLRAIAPPWSSSRWLRRSPHLAAARGRFAFLAIGWGALLVEHIVNLDRLVTLGLEGRRTPSVPESRGSWGGAWSAIYRRMRHGRAHERDLTHTIERFQSAAEAIPDGMVVLDATNRIKWANHRAQSLLGLDLAQDRGAPLVNLVRQPEFVRYLESDDYRDGIVIDSQRDPGVTLAIQIVPFGVAEKLLIARDVTQLESVARMRRDFIANVSHELKTPLTVISGFVETLQELELDERQRARFLQLMREQAASMQRLVEDLLTLSALESEQNPLADERVRDRSAAARDLGRCEGAVEGQPRDVARHRRRRDHRRAAARSSRAHSATSSPTRSATRRREARSRSRGASTPTARACSR